MKTTTTVSPADTLLIQTKFEVVEWIRNESVEVTRHSPAVFGMERVSQWLCQVIGWVQDSSNVNHGHGSFLPPILWTEESHIQVSGSDGWSLIIIDNL